MGKRWRIFPHDAGRVNQLERAARVPAIVAQLLLCRGIGDPTAAQIFLDPKLNRLRDPEELPGVPEAVERIYAAVSDRRRIIIYGDYDADGMTGTAILLSCLRMLSADVGYYVPNRLDDGYGLNDEALRQLASQGTSMVITVDCGIASVDHAATARELGLELIITDHHEPGDELPPADTIVHPRLPGGKYGFGGLCGAGVAFKLAWALCQRASDAKKVSPRMRDFLMTVVGLAALGTVADVVPLVDENRILVRHGLTSLKHQAPPGIRAILQLTKLSEKKRLSSEDIAFTIAPRLNAAGRLGQAQLGVELLTTESAERALALAEYIQTLNENRDTLDRSIYKQANKQVKEDFDPKADPALVLAGRGWHPGVIGIVAGRIAERYNRPTIIISLDEYQSKPATGSARTACGLNLHEGLRACTNRLVAHGGHAAAAGLKIDESEVDAFRAEFLEYAASRIKADDRVAELAVDVEAPLSQLTLSTVQQIEQLAPFGAGNPRPVLCATGVKQAAPPKAMGSGDRHLSVKLTQHDVTLRAVAFGKGEWCDELAETDTPLDVAFRPVINEFRERRNVELHLLDWRPSETSAHQ